MYKKEERDEQIKKMQTISDAFYRAAIQAGAHGFIEFCGFMNEYIKVCQATSEAGIDFNEANTHTGKSLVVSPHNVEYLAEKLDCIFGPTLADPKMRAVFFKAMGWAP